MKGEILFEKMTGISDEYVAEAALVAPVGVESHKRNRFSSLSSALNSGWGVACICFVVAIATVVGMVAWGRMGDDVPTVPPVHQPAPRFSFSYDMRSSDGSDWNGTALPGDTVYVDTSVLNQGKSFDTYDFFAHAHFVLQGDDTVTLQGVYPVIDTDKHTVDSGDRGSRCFTFFIPENATPGVYDLVLSFDGEEQVFSGVLTVGDPAGDTQPPVDTTDRYDFSFGYELGGDAAPGTFYHMDTWVVNEGASFTFEGSSMGFAPSAVLIHMETQYRIEGAFDTTTDFTTVTVKTGDKGQTTQEFMIPADAPTGVYALQLSYGGVTKSFAGAVIVTNGSESTDEKPIDELWTLAEGYLKQLVSNVDPVHYTRGTATTTTTPSAEYTVCFSFYVNILGTETAESFRVTLNSKGQYLSHEQDPQTYSLFIPYVTTEMVEAAKPPLYTHPDYPLKLLHQYGYTVKDGDLYLTYDCFDGSDTVGEGAREHFYSTTVFLYENPQKSEFPAVLYNLTMPIGSEWLYEPIDEAYVDGELVTVRFKCGADMEPLLILNEAFVEATAGNEQTGYLEYSFYMPDEDSEIYFYTYDRTLPYAAMLESCIAWDHYNFSEKEFYYYGQTEKGVMVALLLGNGEAITRTNVGNYQFITPTTHELMAYYNGGLYRLRIAYEDYELLTEEDLADLFAMHQSLFPDCYVDMPSPK